MKSDVFFVATLQGWPGFTKQTCEQSDTFFVTTLQGWAYKTQRLTKHNKHARCIDDRMMFSFIARMGLQKNE